MSAALAPADDWSWVDAPFPNGETLRPHQKIAARFLLSGPGRFRLLAMLPRLGKTYASIAALNGFLQDFGGHVVVVCPAGLRASWRSKIDELRAGAWKATVVSYGDLGAGKTEGLPAEIDVLVLDEAHAIKTRDSLRTQAVLGEKCDGSGGIARRAKFVYALSGTPSPNSPAELWPLLRAFAPAAITGANQRPMGWGDFRDTYCAVVRTMHGCKVVGGKRLPELRRRMAPFTLSQDYGVLPDVPEPPVPEIVHVEVSRSDARAIRELEHSAEGRAVRHALATGGVAALGKLGTHAATLRRLLGIAKVGPVADMAAEYLAADPTLKLVVFAHHQEVVQALKRRLAAHGAVAWTGGMTPGEQDAAKRVFWHDPKVRVLVGSITAASEGLDFSVSDLLIRAESSWVPGQNTQADARLWNITKRRRVAVKVAVLKGTLDDDVMRAVEQKSKTAKRLFG